MGIDQEEFAKAFEWIRYEVRRLRHQWDTYTGFFSDDKSIEILGNGGGFAMSVVQGAMSADFSMTIARLLDEAISFNKYHNLSLAWIIKNLPEDIADATRNKAIALVDEIQLLCAPLSALRDKELAHNDYETVLTRHPLAYGMSFQEIETVLDRMTDFVDVIKGHFKTPPTAREQVIRIGGAKRLVEVIADGLKFRDILGSFMDQRVSPEMLNKWMMDLARERESKGRLDHLRSAKLEEKG